MHKWNWGACLIGPIWGIRFRVWQAVVLPLCLGVIGAFINGMYGTEWAWSKRRNDDLMTFNDAQHRWTKIGIIANVIGVATVVIMLILE